MFEKSESKSSEPLRKEDNKTISKISYAEMATALKIVADPRNMDLVDDPRIVAVADVLRKMNIKTIKDLDALSPEKWDSLWNELNQIAKRF